MRRLLPVLALVALLVTVFTVAASAAPHCSPGQEPVFLFGFAHLKSLLGDRMGEPIECEHTNPDNGDTLQNTTTGLAFYRKFTNTPTFTNGWEHWAWTDDGLVYWTGSEIDPPGSATSNVMGDVIRDVFLARDADCDWDWDRIPTGTVTLDRSSDIFAQPGPWNCHE